MHFKADDLFTYFTALAASGSVPPIEDLEAVAKKLYRAYSTQHAAERALEEVGDLESDLDHPKTGAWKSAVPLGSDWTPPVVAAANIDPAVLPPSASAEPETMTSSQSAGSGKCKRLHALQRC